MKVSWGMIKDKTGAEHGFGVWVNLTVEDSKPSEGDKIEAVNKAGKSSMVTLFEKHYENTKPDGSVLQLWSILGRDGQEPISKKEINKIGQKDSQESNKSQNDVVKKPLDKVPTRNKSLFELEKKSDESSSEEQEFPF